MAEQLVPFSLTSPGFFGLNTQDGPVDLRPEFALEATNCVIDKLGRVGSRKGWTPAHAANVDLGSANITCIGEHCAGDGTRTILAAGNGNFFKLSGGALTTLTYGGGGVAPTITADNWQFVSQNGAGLFFQIGHDPLMYDPALSTTTYRRISEHPSYSGTVPLANAALSAFGRVWAGGTTTDKQTIYWSDTLTHHKWSGGAAGSLNLLGVWPQGGDEIVALAQHNNSLIIFGTKQVLVYTGADDPASMSLSDSISNTGCAARDSVANTGEDIIFLSDTGVRSIARTIQEKSAPIRTVSRNVNDDIKQFLLLDDADDIKAVYSPSEAFYLITFPASAVTYCFDMRTPLQDGSSRATSWLNINPKAFCYAKDTSLYMGQAGYVGKHEGYYDNGAEYRLSYFTSWVDFGNPLQTSILKTAILTIIGLSNQTIVFKWAYDYSSTYFSKSSLLSGVASPAEYGTAEYGVAEYAGNVAINTLRVPGTSCGKVLQFGLEALVGGYKISIQRIDLYAKAGRLA